MNDFTEFDAFQLCRDFARAIAVPLNGGVFAVDFGYLQIEQFEPIDSLGVRASQCLGALMRHLNTSEMRGRKFTFHSDRKR
jgi:hypothetical protein